MFSVTRLLGSKTIKLFSLPVLSNGCFFMVLPAAFSGTLTAAVYDLSSDWSNSSNPNGPWSYNQGSTPLRLVPNFNFDNTGQPSSCNQPAWAPSNAGGDFLPAFLKVNACTTAYENAEVPANVTAGDVWVHTVDSFNGNPSFGAANVLFTLPASGTAGAYTISGSLWDSLGLSATSVSRPQDWSLFLNGVQIAAGVLSGSVSRSQAETFSMVENLNVGDHVELQIVKDPAADAGFIVSINLTITPLSPPVTTGSDFVPLAPCRLVDTRNPNGAFGGPSMTAGSSRAFVIPSGGCGVPGTATAYSLNVTAVPHGPLGYLTIWPSGQSQPVASTLNSDGRIKANAAIVPAGSNGAVSVFVTDTTDVILDINGYFVSGNGPGALSLYTLPPCRIADTRNPAGVLGGPSLVAASVRTFPILSSACDVSTTAQAYSLNFTAVPQGSLGYLTSWPAGQSQPLVSSLNSPTGTIVANAVIVPTGNSGAVSVFSTDQANLVIDINGYFAPPASGGLALYTMQPCRVLDTRQSPGTPISSLTFSVLLGPCAVPANAQAYVFNATVVPTGPLGFLTIWPEAQPQPLVSTLNALDGAITSNLAIVPTTNGSISIYATQPTHLILDLSGYFAP
jgi:hypothetical protein